MVWDMVTAVDLAGLFKVSNVRENRRVLVMGYSRYFMPPPFSDVRSQRRSLSGGVAAVWTVPAATSASTGHFAFDRVDEASEVLSLSTLRKSTETDVDQVRGLVEGNDVLE